MKSKTTVILAAALLFAALLFSSLNMPYASAAPSAAPTAVAVDRSTAPASVAVIANDAIVADGIIGCTNSASHEKADIQYVIDQTLINTVTLTLQFTNDTPGSGASYTDGVAIVSSNTADAASLNQFQLFGAWTCIHANVANANPLDVTVKALLK